PGRTLEIERRRRGTRAGRRALDAGTAVRDAHLAGHEHLSVDATLIATDRPHEPGLVIGRNGNPIDLWWSGKHRHRGGNLQIITAPDGWPIWSSDVRPGREHDITALRTHPGLRQASRGW
ncbi:transposase family protein, partial [Nocardia gipuzkoensis]|uniref:transposase family protein n=1 Tax=Nocardia gipuzkoensis TaxID=2749991 RepID=UPI00237D745C